MIDEEEKIKSKFSHIYMMLMYGIMKNDLTNVRHYLSSEVYEKYQNQIENNISNNERQMFDELNVKSIEIIDKTKEEAFDVVNVKLISRHMDYVIDLKTNKYKRGINDHRIEKIEYLTFMKKKEINEIKTTVKCKSCGANMDLNITGKCEFCGTIQDALDHGYILTNIK